MWFLFSASRSWSYGYTHGTHHDDDDGGGGSGPTLDCRSDDGTNSPGCFKNRTDEQLESLINGNAGHPLDPPVVCGMEFTTPDEVRWALRGSGSSSSPCNKLKRDVLTTILSICKSILLGDGILGEDPAGCAYFCTGDDDDGGCEFRIVLRCGDVFIPDDALVVTEDTPLGELADLASQLCELAECPSSTSQLCGHLEHD